MKENYFSNLKWLTGFFLIAIIFLTIFFKSPRIFAADAYLTGCLRVKSIFPCYESHRDKYQCLNSTDIDFSLFDNKQDHIAKVEGEGFPLGKQIYIVGCISTNEGVKCTTGDSELNKIVNRIGFVTVDSISGYEFKPARNPVVSSDGRISLFVRSATTTHQDHHIFGVVEVEKTDYQSPDQPKTVEYGTFGFSDDPKKCISIAWDPKGRVFDAVTLEPLEEVLVTLYDESRQVYKKIGLQNPLLTKEDGVFNFFVENGVYYLEPRKSGYQFPVEFPKINPNFTKLYYCDSEVGQPLYYNQFPIPEKNKLIHCDVALYPLGNPRIRDIQVMEFGQMVLGQTTKFFGRFSHPFTIVRLTQNEGILKEGIADKFGAWEFLVKNSQIATNGSEIVLTGLKNPNFFQVTDTTSKNLFFRVLEKIELLIFSKVFSQSKKTTLVFNPILRLVEGYAYDATGKVVPNAFIEVVTEMNNKTYYKTRADERGYFKINSNNLPIFPFFLKITPVEANSGSVVILSTSQFIRLNQKYLQERKINLITGLISSPNETIFNKDQKVTTALNNEKERFIVNSSPFKEKKPDSNNFLVNSTQKPNKNKQLVKFSILIIALMMIAIIFTLSIFLKSKYKINNPS